MRETWRYQSRTELLFQFLSRNSVRWDPREYDANRARYSFEFQFLSRNSVRWDPDEERMPDGMPGFNSSVGILSVGTKIG